MTVKMNNANGSVCSVHTSQKGKGDGMIPTKRNDSWQSFSFFRRAFFLCISCG